MDFIQIDDLFNHVSMEAVEARRVLYSRIAHRNFGGVVRYGPLKGLKIDSDSSWGPGDVAPKLFGLYEQEILKAIADLKGKFRFLVNIGAADGYYGVGLVAAGICEQSVCFETSEKGRDSISKTAQRNGVADKIKIYGEAGADFPQIVAALGMEPADCLVLCDIEGGEYSLFSSECLSKLRAAHIIIELHDFLVPNGVTLEQNLIATSGQLFDASIVKTSARDLSQFPELNTINDTDRWLICSEGRAKLMSWLLLAPRNNPQQK